MNTTTIHVKCLILIGSCIAHNNVKFVLGKPFNHNFESISASLTIIQAKLVHLVENLWLESEDVEAILELMADTNKHDQSWDLVNSLYYCSSLYTTVGKLIDKVRK